MEVLNKPAKLQSAIDYMENTAFGLFPASRHHLISCCYLASSGPYLLRLCFPYISTVLLKFRTDKGRDPDPQSFAEDSELLMQIRDDVLGALEVSSDLLSDDFTRYKASSTVM